MKDFTKKGTKLPVIPVGTLARTSLLHTNGSEKSFKMATDKKRLVSYGMLDEKWLKCDNPDYNGSDFYLIKLSTIERLAKEQGMYNTNKEIETKTEFKIGDCVQVIRDGANASDFTLKIPSCKPNGVYSMVNWEKAKFQILGNYEPITFEHNPKIYGAYPLGIDGKIIGYIYNDAIQHY